MSEVPLERRLPSLDTFDWIQRGLDLSPAKVAVRYLADGDPNGEAITVTYAELKCATIAAANLFYSLDVRHGDPVVFLLPTSPELYGVMLGSIATGVSCCVNWMLGAEHWIELIAASRAKVVVALGPTPGFEIWDKLSAVRDRLPPHVRVLSVAIAGGRRLPETDFATLCAAQPSDALTFERSVKPDDIAALIHSGGTTGAPKLVKLTHRGFSYKFWANSLVMAHTCDDVIFADYPMFHIAGFFARGLLAIACGMEIVIPSPLGAREKRFIENYWTFVQAFRITILSGVPTTLANLCKVPTNGADLRSLRPYGVTGSTAFPAEVARQLKAICGVTMLGSYGATEYTQNVAQPPRDGDPRYGSAGLRLPFTEIGVVEIDEAGHIVRHRATDEIGLVVVRGPSVTPGYVDPRHDAGVLLPGGWFNSGDLGRLDADGYLWITGRAKDVIIRGGHNIDPTVVEETLLKHPDVLLVAVVARPDPYAGEVPMAYVQMIDGATTTVFDLAAFAQAHTPERAAAPRHIVRLEVMPLTDVGKPAKVELRRNAAREAFAALLELIVGEGRGRVDIVDDASSGQRARLHVLGVEQDQRPAIEAAITTATGVISIPLSILWDGDNRL